jgi:hypothetical protein
MYIFAVALQDGTWHHEKSYSPERAHRADKFCAATRTSTVRIVPVSSFCCVATVRGSVRLEVVGRERSSMPCQVHLLATVEAEVVGPHRLSRSRSRPDRMRRSERNDALGASGRSPPRPGLAHGARHDYELSGVRRGHHESSFGPTPLDTHAANKESRCPQNVDCW